MALNNTQSIKNYSLNTIYERINHTHHMGIPAQRDGILNYTPLFYLNPYVPPKEGTTGPNY
jgi:hypothetical protein